MSKKKIIIMSHWSKMIEGLQESPMDFFEKTEAAIENKEMEKIKKSRIDFKEGGVFSAKREYLRIQRKNLVFDICGAPFGNGFFISWWLGETPSGLLGFLSTLPGIDVLVLKFFNAQTYYKIDTAMMFQSLVHSAVLEVLDDMIKEKGLKSLAPADRVPKMRDFFDL